MEIKHNYDYFLAIAETGSITGAARRCFISQPSMSQYLNKLEKSLGVSLFDRSTNPLTLTRAGEIFMDYVRKRAALDEELRENLGGLNAAITGNVLLGIPLQMQVLLAREVIPPFADRHPYIDITIRDDASPALEKSIKRSRIDCALIYSHLDSQKDLTYHFLKRERLFFVCSKDNKLLEGKKSSKDHPIPLTFSDIRDLPFYLMDQGFIVRDISDRFFMKHAFTPKKRTSMSGMDALLQAACMSNGITLLPEYVIDAYGNPEDIAYLELEGERFSIDLFLVYRSDLKLSPAAECLISFIEDYYSRVK